MMKTKLIRNTTIAGLVAFLPVLAGAQTFSAQFTVTSLNGGGWVDNEESFGSGEPDRYFHFGVFDSNSNSLFNLCAVSCTSADSDPATLSARVLTYLTVNTGEGFWDFPDQSVTMILAGPQAYFYFGLWDRDNDADDSLGDHWFLANGNQSGTVVNNNLSPYYADNPIQTVGLRDVEGVGSAGNFEFSYEITFSEISAVPLPAPFWLLAAGLAGLLRTSARNVRS